MTRNVDAPEWLVVTFDTFGLPNRGLVRRTREESRAYARFLRKSKIDRGEIYYHTSYGYGGMTGVQVIHHADPNPEPLQRV
jgi:hypothetical protein